MKKRRLNILLRLVIFWFVVLSVASIITGTLSFFPAINNFEDYSFLEFVKYEVSYLIRTVYTLFLLSGLFSLPAFVIGYFIIISSKRFSGYFFIILNLVLLLLYCLIMDKYGVFTSGASFNIVLPVYSLTIVLFSLILLRTIRKMK